jgi:hypothetical protein
MEDFDEGVLPVLVPLHVHLQQLEALVAAGVC